MRRTHCVRSNLRQGGHALQPGVRVMEEGLFRGGSMIEYSREAMLSASRTQWRFHIIK